MTRSVKIKLYATESKLRKLRAVESRFLSACNRYIKFLWGNKGGLDKATADVVPLGHLPFNYRAAALRQALGIVKATRESQRATVNKATRPVVKRGVKVNQKCVSITFGKSSKAFDTWLRVSTLRSGCRINVPAKSTKVLNKWLSKPGAVLAKGCELSLTNRGAYAILWIDIPDLALRSEGAELGVDCGVSTVLATSDGNLIGRDFKTIGKAVRMAKPGGQGMRRARTTRDRYLNRCVNQLPWGILKTVAVEDLTGLKIGKQPKRGKQFRKLLAPWRYASVLGRVEQKARENCVLFVRVNPAYTSQTCPECSHRANDNRTNEKFQCGSCGHTANADTVGARNILIRARGSVSSPRVSRTRQLVKHKPNAGHSALNL